MRKTITHGSQAYQKLQKENPRKSVVFQSSQI